MSRSASLIALTLVLLCPLAMRAQITDLDPDQVAARNPFGDRLSVYMNRKDGVVELLLLDSTGFKTKKIALEDLGLDPGGLPEIVNVAWDSFRGTWVAFFTQFSNPFELQLLGQTFDPATLQPTGSLATDLFPFGGLDEKATDEKVTASVDPQTGREIVVTTCKDKSGKKRGCAAEKGPRPDDVWQPTDLGLGDLFVNLPLPNGDVVTLHTTPQKKLAAEVRTPLESFVAKALAEYSFPSDLLPIEEIVAKTDPDGKTIWVVVSGKVPAGECTERDEIYVGSCPMPGQGGAGKLTLGASAPTECTWKRVSPCTQVSYQFFYRNLVITYNLIADVYLAAADLAISGDPDQAWVRFLWRIGQFASTGASSAGPVAAETAAATSPKDFDYMGFGGHSPAPVATYADPGHAEGKVFPADFDLFFRDQFPGYPEQTYFYDLQAPCVDGTRSFCLNRDGFRVAATWLAADGAHGAGNTVELTDDTGYLWFFNPDNVETVLKVLDNCAVSGREWVFAAGLTSVETHLVVQKLSTGETHEYVNPQGTPFQPIQDTDAFTCSAADTARSRAQPPPAGLAALQAEIASRVEAAAGPAAPALATVSAAAAEEASAPGPLSPRSSTAGSTGCVAGNTALCLNHDRFRVDITYETAQGASGSGHAVPLTSDTGYFWFFDDTNVEAVVKVLDACAINGYRWVFGAGLTSVGAELTVRDTVSGQVKKYPNRLGHPFQPIQDTKAFPCS